MSRHAKTQRTLDEAKAVLAAHNPMTVRQVFYQLVSGQVLENTRAAYKAVSRILRDGRLEGLIPWEWIEDRLRQPREVAMWSGLPAFAEKAVAAYRRNVWARQPLYQEVWLEKDALSGIFERVLWGYGVTLNVGRGYDGWSSIHAASGRFEIDDVVLYFGDFDPSGEDMVRSLRVRLASLGCKPEIIKCALTADDVERYHLPPALTKRTDTRRARFVARHGDIAVELDALPAAALEKRIREEVESRMDLDALNEVLEQDADERRRLGVALAAVGEETEGV